jgi:hypothetical protein
VCHLITVAVSPQSIDAAAAFRARKLVVAPAVNASVGKALPASAELLGVTDGRCSCSISVGIGHGDAFDESTEFARYLKKGWSRVKAQRAVDAKKAAQNRPHHESESEQFLVALEDIVASGGSIRLVSHFYSGDFSREQVAIETRIEMSCRELREKLGVLPDDTVLTIVR